MAKPILVLDVDGVVLPIEQRGPAWLESLQRDLGIDLERMREEFFVPHYRQCQRGELDYEETLAHFLAETGASCTAREFLDYTLKRESGVDTAVVEAAVSWKERAGGTLALGTNQMTSRAAFIWEDLGMKDHCDMIIASCYVGAPKPEAAFYQAADKLLKRREGQEVIFLDDTLSHVEGATAHGWTAHHMNQSEEIVSLIKSLMTD